MAGVEGVQSWPQRLEARIASLRQSALHPLTLLPYLAALTAVAVPSALGLWFRDLPELDLGITFVLGNILVAARCGRGPTILAGVLSVAAFDFFFAEPRFSLQFSEQRYLLTFSLMIVAAIAISEITAALRRNAQAALRREARARTLFEFTRDLARCESKADVADALDLALEHSIGVAGTLLLPEPSGGFRTAQPIRLGKPFNQDAAQKALDRGMPVRVRPSEHGEAAEYFPVRSLERNFAVLRVTLLPSLVHLGFSPQELIETLTTLSAMVFERMFQMEHSQRALVEAESERLRNAVLSALSHDLRSPLASMCMVAETLLERGTQLPERERKLTRDLHERAQGVARMATNLLELARVESGALQVRPQWLPLEEIVGAAIGACRRVLDETDLFVGIEPGLPFVYLDPTLLERVLANLLDNAAVHAGPMARIQLLAVRVGDELELSVEDNGPGIAAMDAERVFDKFTRGAQHGSGQGMGLGLAICKQLVTAHGARIWVERGAEGGARFAIRFPAGHLLPAERERSSLQSSPR